MMVLLSRCGHVSGDEGPPLFYSRQRKFGHLPPSETIKIIAGSRKTCNGPNDDGFDWRN